MTTTLRYDLIFVNLPVADLARSRAFFTALGYEFDDRMCNDDGLALVLGPTQDVILLRDVLAFSAAEVAARWVHRWHR